MLINEIRSRPPRVLTEEQRESYFENGYLVLEKVIDDEWLRRLREVTNEMIDRSRTVTASDSVFDIEPNHTAEEPRLRRLSSPPDHDPVYWEYAAQSVLPDIVADLVGPNVAFHHSKLNFKWSRGGAEVKWHQDIQYWPHTNYSPLTVGTYLYDCGMEQGPVGVIPGSHKGPLYDLYGPDGRWTGSLSEADAASLPADKAVYFPAPAGSITIHNCRMVHSSMRNESGIARPLLLNVYSAADALPYTPNPIPSRYSGTVVRGERPRWSHTDPDPCLLPPDWSNGYISLFAYQQNEVTAG